MVLMSMDGLAFKIVATALFIIASLTDLIDGKWARKYNQVTELGKFLDPLADKMLVNLTFLMLVVANVVPIWMFAVILVRDFAVDGIRMMLARSGQTLAAGWHGKVKTTIQMIVLSVLILNTGLDIAVVSTICHYALYIVVFLTVYSGAEYLIKGWQRLKEES